MDDGIAKQDQSTFLVVDDEPVNAMLLETVLVARGFKVITAANGEEAVERFKEHPIDMVLMDIMMPGIDGYEATRRIKALDRGGFVPVLFVTALTDEQRLAQCVEAGGDDFITKPISRVQLNAKIEAWLRTRELYRTVVAQRDVLRSHQARLEHEQETAERIVARATSSNALNTPGLRYFYSPAAILSGDILLAGRRPNGNLLILIGDFTGHGIGAAVGVPGLAAVYYDLVARGTHPAEMLDAINEKLFRSLPPDMFLTAALIEVDSGRRRVGVWNAGMPPVMLISDGELVATFTSSDLPLGVERNSAPGRRQLSYLDIPERSYLYACSDGIVEVAGEGGSLYGDERLEQTLKNATPGSGFDDLLKQVNDFRSASEPSDDTTLIELDFDSLISNSSCIGYGAAEAVSWKTELVLDARTLAHVNPVPPMMNLLADLGALEEDRQSLYVVIAELFTNALEHGVLGLDSSLKRNEEGFDSYYQRRAQAMADLDAGEVYIRLHYDPDASGRGVVIEVEDTGPGFDYERILAASDSRDVASAIAAGRGIMLVRALCEDVEYFPPGNRVRVRYKSSA
ncbi:ATP-binding SpoIIE family protein phosphatase [Halorhodospira halochloris]|uniref:ATP-binding SpoIIE family protein phosphatase n=1 Tax=Halorhodospira halochloris TaxID=1052 RepID=UPI001EE79F2D|nr:SpoIIE family protein phosphatase [Halorhodospira halochloris]